MDSKGTILKILVLGASGQLGSVFSEMAMLQNHQILCTDSKLLNIRSIDVVEKITKIRPNLILNCAAWTNVEDTPQNLIEAFDINCLSLRKLTLAASICDATLIHISTDYVYSGYSAVPWKESDYPDPINTYGITKYAGELLLRQFKEQPIYILRTAWLYSDRRVNFVTKILRKIQDGSRSIEVVEDQFGQPTNAYDLSVAILEIIEKSIPTGIYNITNSGYTSWFEFAKVICGALELDDNIIKPIKSNFTTSDHRPLYSVLDNSLIQKNGVTPLPNWKTSFLEIFPKIIENTNVN